MPTRDERREAAAKNLALMRGAFASETKATVEAARVYENGEGRELPVAEGDGETATSVTTDFAPKAVFSAQGKVVVVDPCSFTRPGGAYEDGSFGPEQILCAESNLYPALRSCKELYHDKNRGYSCGMLFTDRALYLPDVAFVRDGTIRRADVLAIPEPVRARAIENHRSERECEHTLADRIEALLRIAAANGAETLVVGAFGCRKASPPSCRFHCSRHGSRPIPGPSRTSRSPCRARASTPSTPLLARRRPLSLKLCRQLSPTRTPKTTSTSTPPISPRE